MDNIMTVLTTDGFSLMTAVASLGFVFTFVEGQLSEVGV